MGVVVPKSGTRGNKPRNGPLVRFGMKVATWFHRHRHDRALGLDVLYLTTVGARTGQERTVPLAWCRAEEPGWLVIGSAGGSSRSPAWIVNMAARPDQVSVEVGGRRERVTASTLPPDEAAAFIRELAAHQPRYAGYQEKTDRV